MCAQHRRSKNKAHRFEAISLLLVTPGLATATSSLELASPGASEWLDMAARASSSSKVLLGLTRLAWSLDHQSVLASRRPQSQLVKGDDFTSSLKDPLPSLLSNTQSAESHLGHIKDPQIVGDGANADGELGGVALLQVPHKASQR